MHLFMQLNIGNKFTEVYKKKNTQNVETCKTVMFMLFI